MNLLTITITIVGLFLIYRIARREWKKADSEQRMRDTLLTEEIDEKVTDFMEHHKNPKPKNKHIKDFNKNNY